MANAQSLKSKHLISRRGTWLREVILGLILFCLVAPIVFLSAMVLMAKSSDYLYLRHIEVGKTLSVDLEREMCASLILKCLEDHQYSSGAFRSEDRSQRRLFVQSLIEIDGGADYFDLDKNRRVLNKSQIRSP